MEGNSRYNVTLQFNLDNPEEEQMLLALKSMGRFRKKILFSLLNRVCAMYGYDYDGIGKSVCDYLNSPIPLPGVGTHVAPVVKKPSEKKIKKTAIKKSPPATNKIILSDEDLSLLYQIKHSTGWDGVKSNLNVDESTSDEELLKLLKKERSGVVLYDKFKEKFAEEKTEDKPEIETFGWDDEID